LVAVDYSWLLATHTPSLLAVLNQHYN